MIASRNISSRASAVIWDGWRFEPFRQTTENCIAALKRLPRHPELKHPDVEEMFDALSFMLWKYRVATNVHLTINWEEMGVAPSLVPEILGKYLNELQKWLKGGSQTHRRRGDGPRPHVKLHYVWVHETDSKRGLHSHVMMQIPFKLFASYRAWTYACICRHLGRQVPSTAIFAKPGYHKSSGWQVNQQWIWFKYLIKQLNPGDQIDLFGQKMFSRQLFHPFHRRHTVEMIPIKMYGVSRSIGRKQRVSHSFLSFYQQAKFNRLYDGEELADSDPMIRSLCLGSSEFAFANAYVRHSRPRMSQVKRPRVK